MAPNLREKRYLYLQAYYANPENRARKAASDKAYRLEHLGEIKAKKRERYLAQREEIAKKHRAYYETHAEEMKSRSKKYYQTNLVSIKVKSQAYRDSHKQEIAEQGRKYRQKNKAKLAAQKKAYSQAHPEKEYEHLARRRARKAASTYNDLTIAQWEEIKAAYEYRCVYCPKDCWRCQRKKHALTQDHITPLGPDGSHTLHNVVPACVSCNSKKHRGPVLKPVQPLLLTIASAKKTKSQQAAAD